jgi:hypothetical protein
VKSRTDNPVGRRHTRAFTFLAHLFFFLVVTPALAAETADVRWVHGSWVNVRATASPKDAVIARLTANTQVRLLSRQGPSCEIASKLPETRGFMACSLLGEQPLLLADVGTPPLDGDKPNPRYSPTRAFWLAPSVVRLQAAGDYFWSTMLSAAQQKKERPFLYREPQESEPPFDWNKRPNPVRFPVPEFDAMKDLLKNGIVAAPERRPVITKWSELKQAVTDSRPDRMPVGIYIDESALALMREGKLTPVKASLFKRADELAPRFASVEQISAQFGIKERLRVLSGPKWVHFRHEEPYIKGNWDMGSFEIVLDEPVFEFMVGRRGLASARQWTATDIQKVDAEGGCEEGFGLPLKAARRLPDYPQVKDPLVWFYVPKALPYKKVSIKTYAKRLDPKTDKNASGQNAQFTLLVMRDIDLDSDGVADLAVWEGMRAVTSSGDMLALRIIFANIAGEWHLLDAESVTECS